MRIAHLVILVRNKCDVCPANPRFATEFASNAKLLSSLALQSSFVLAVRCRPPRIRTRILG